MPLTIKLNDIDVTNAYAPDKGAIEIVDALNQPTTCSLLFTRSMLSADIIGGELLLIFDETQVYFYGIVPVENGVGNEFFYLDELTGLYRKFVQVHAVDFQAVLDFNNLPERIFYGQSSGSIFKTMLALCPATANIDTANVSDGYILPSFSVAGRKFTNAATELAKLNGFYVALRPTGTFTSGVPDLQAEFRSLRDRPAPLSIDNNAMSYILSTLKFDPRQKPLVNKVTVVGGKAPSDDVRTDVFTGDGVTGGFQLSSVPYFLKQSEVYTSNFSSDLSLWNPTTRTGEYTQVDGSGANIMDPALGIFKSGALQNSELLFAGHGALAYNVQVQSQDQRYSMWEEIRLDSGSSYICGLMTAVGAASINVSNIAVGVWFKPDQTLSLILAGTEVIPFGNPTWQARDVTGSEAVPSIYSVRIKQTLDPDNSNGTGTIVEIQGGNISPPRHWMPLTAPGDKASGFWGFEYDDTATVAPTPPDPSWPLDTENGLYNYVRFALDSSNLPVYYMTSDDLSDTSLQTLHESLVAFLNGQSPFNFDYYTEIAKEGIAIVGGTVATDGTIEITLTGSGDAGWVDGSIVDIDSVAGLTEANGTNWTIHKTGNRTFTLNSSDGTGQTYTSGGTAFRHLPKVNFFAKSGGTQFNQTITASWLGPLKINLPDFGGLSGGTNASLNLASTPTEYFTGNLSISGAGAVYRIVTKDPIGVDVKLKRAVPPTLPDQDMANYDDITASQQEVILSVCGADEVSDLFSCQVIMEGAIAFLSFFDNTQPDQGSPSNVVPQKGDILEVAYQYPIDIRVTVRDNASIEFVKSRSHIPGDDGVREEVELDVNNRHFTVDSARRYGLAYLKDRSRFGVQGSVHSTSYHTNGATPMSGQVLAFLMSADDRNTSEVITQVTTRHKGRLSNFDYEIAFGALPDEFLLPTEDPSLSMRPAVLAYDSSNTTDNLRLADTLIRFTVVGP